MKKWVEFKFWHCFIIQILIFDHKVDIPVESPYRHLLNTQNVPHLDCGTENDHRLHTYFSIYLCLPYSIQHENVIIRRQITNILKPVKQQ